MIDHIRPREKPHHKEPASPDDFLMIISQKNMQEMSAAENKALKEVNSVFIKKLAAEVNYKSLMSLLLQGATSWTEVMATMKNSSGDTTANTLRSFFRNNPDLPNDQLANLVYNLSRLLAYENIDTGKIKSFVGSAFGVQDVAVDASRVRFSGMGTGDADFSKEQLRWGVRLAFQNSAGLYQLPYVHIDQSGAYSQTTLFALSAEQFQQVQRHIGATATQEKQQKPEVVVSSENTPPPELRTFLDNLQKANNEFGRKLGSASSYSELLGLFGDRRGSERGVEISAVESALAGTLAVLSRPENAALLENQDGYRIAVAKKGLTKDDATPGAQQNRALAWLEYRMNQKFSDVDVRIDGFLYKLSNVLVLELRKSIDRSGVELVAVGNVEGSFFRDRITAAKALMYDNGGKASAYLDRENLAILEALDAALVPDELSRATRRRGAEAVLNKQDHARYVRLMDLKDAVARFDSVAGNLQLGSINTELRRHPLPRDIQASKVREDEIALILSPIQSAIERYRTSDASGNEFFQIRQASPQESTQPTQVDKYSDELGHEFYTEIGKLHDRTLEIYNSLVPYDGTSPTRKFDISLIDEIRSLILIDEKYKPVIREWLSTDGGDKDVPYPELKDASHSELIEILLTNINGMLSLTSNGTRDQIAEIKPALDQLVRDSITFYDGLGLRLEVNTFFGDDGSWSYEFRRVGE